MQDDGNRSAPGGPGMPARWTSGAKSGVGTSLSQGSRVWFTLSHGIFNEIYYPLTDHACVRDMEMIVTDGQSFFSEEKRHTEHETRYLAEGVPGYRITNTCREGRYRIEKEILTDSSRDALLQWTRFTPLKGKLSDYHLYVLLAPHIGNQGANNNAWVDEYKGIKMIFAQRGGTALAITASVPWLKTSVGYVGSSDGWQDLSQHKEMAWEYTRADNGNVALTGEIDLSASDGTCLIAVGFGVTPAEAGFRARAALQQDYQDVRHRYISEWRNWQQRLLPLDEDWTIPEGRHNVYRTSAFAMRVHEAKAFAGGIIAGLSIPWGYAKGDYDLGGYHLVWPRDLVEAAGGLLAMGALGDAKRVLDFLRATQEADGHWPQNMWLDGTQYWTAVQMDETAFPILLADMAKREGAITDDEWLSYWGMVRNAAACIARSGPVTQEDRWEEDAGYTPFTLAVEVAGLLAAADLADTVGENDTAQYLRETADAWNASIERWIYVKGTDLAEQVGVDGYYVRLAPPDVIDRSTLMQSEVQIKNRPPGSTWLPAPQVVSTDALALVRFGLRAPNDPRIVNTVKVIDALLKVDTPEGPAWHRYNDDGYGEQADGSAFDGTGIGRAWPLLAGERAHYELAAGRHDQARSLQRTIEAFSNDGGLLPEQVWDSEDIPGQDLFCGRPTGSATPLVWAHSEYVKLVRSIRDGRVFDMPPQTVERYIANGTGSPHTIWRFNNKIQRMPAGRVLRIETLANARVRWSVDGWQTTQDIDVRDTHLGIYVADLDTASLEEGSTVQFTFYWPAAGDWEGTNYEVTVTQPDSSN